MVSDNEDTFERIRKAVEARDAFLREHPELQPLQDEITRLMRNAETPENRMAILEDMMRERVRELQRRLEELADSLRHPSSDAETPPEQEQDPHRGKIIGPADAWPTRPDEDEATPDNGDDP